MQNKALRLVLFGKIPTLAVQINTKQIYKLNIVWSLKAKE